MSADEDDIDRRLTRLRATAEAVTANLLELEDLGTLSLLRAGSYEGASSAPIEEALHDIAALNLHYAAFMAFVKRMEALRAEGRFTGYKGRWIDKQLSTPCITLPAEEIDLATRDLLTPVERHDTVTVDRLIQLMNDEFVRAKQIVFEVDGVWRDLVPALGQARGRLARLVATTQQLGEPLPELADLEAKIDWCNDAVATDPLGAGRDVGTQVEPALDRLERHVRDVAAAKHGLAGQLTLARQELAAVVDAVRECDEARSESRRHVVDPQGLLKVDHRYLDDERTGLRPWLDRLDDLQEDGRWRDAQAGLRRWNEQARQVLETARKATVANRRPLDRRNELRGMLSAYEAVARREAATADPELAVLRREAHDELFGEQTDLGRAADQVRRYQAAVRSKEHS